MRLLSARLSAKRRSPFAGLVVLLLGLLVTGGALRRCSPPPPPRPARPTSRRRRQGRALFLVGCASCHGKNGEGIVTKRGTSTAPRWSASAPPRSTSRSAPAGCRWRVPASQAAARRSSTPPRRSPPSRRTSPRSAPARRSRPKSDYDTTGDERRGDRPRRRVLPRPTAPPATTSPASGGALPGRQVRPGLMGVSRQAHLRGACSPARSRCRSSPTRCSSPTEKRDIIAYLKSLRGATRTTAAPRWARSAR